MTCKIQQYQRDRLDAFWIPRQAQDNLRVGANRCSAYLIIPKTCLVIIYQPQRHSENQKVCAIWRRNAPRCLLVKRGRHLKMAPEKRLTRSILHFMTIFWSNPLKSRVCSMYSWVCFSRECRGGLDNVTRMEWLLHYQMASQQLTTMPMIHSHVEILLVVKQEEEGDTRFTHPASLNKCQTCAEHEQAVCFIPISTCFWRYWCCDWG